MTTAFLLLLLTPAADWPGFRGSGDGVSPSKSLPLMWSATENVAWRIDLPGYGQSSPVVFGGRVYVTAVDGPMREKGHVVAYDAATGKKRWQHDFEPTQKAKWSEYISKAAPTPAADVAGLYAFFEGGNLIALSHDGKPLWSRSLVKEYGEFKNNHGLGSSLAQNAELLFVLIDHSGPSYLLAVDKKTGKDRWKVERKSRASWTSPIVVGKDVVVSSNGTVAGYEAADGKLLWEVEGLTGNTLPSACPAPGGVLVGAGISQRDADENKSAASNTFVRLKGGKAERGWKATTRAVANYASPLAYEGHAYFVNSAGVVFCLDLKTGDEKYAKRIDGPCWASPVAADGRVYFFGRNGTTTVIKAGGTFEKLASNKLWEPKESKGDGGTDSVVYGVAAADGAFYVRTGKALYRVGK